MPSRSAAFDTLPVSTSASNGFNHSKSSFAIEKSSNASDPLFALPDGANAVVDAVVSVFASGAKDTDSDRRFRVLYDSRTDPRPSARGELRLLTVSGELWREHRSVVVDAVVRLLQAADWARAHPDEALRHIAAEMSISETAMHRRRLDLAGWCAVGCDPAQVALLAARKDLLLATDSIPDDFPVDAWVDPSIVAEATARQG